MPTRSIPMSDTPQNDEPIIEQDNAVVETNDSIPASETGDDVQVESVEQVDEVEVAKQKANEAFNKQYGEKKQLERELEAIRAKNAAFEQAERERKAAAIGNIPDMPDAFDDDFDAKVKARDEAIIAQTNFNASNQAYLQQQQYSQQQAEQAKQIKQQESIVSYANKAKELGIQQEELQAVGKVVANYGLSDDLIMHIIDDSDGPLIAKHLAANPQDGYTLASMNPYGVSQFLDGIKQKASSLKPRTSSASNPATNLHGNGVDPEAGKYKYSEGATFE